MASGQKSLENSLDLFKNEYDDFVGSLPIELDRDTPCPLALETYTNLYTALYTLQSEISEGQPISQQNIETLLNAHGRMDKASEVEHACFWFEKYFWWREEKQFVCTNSFTANQPRNKHRSKRYSIPPVGPRPPGPPAWPPDFPHGRWNSPNSIESSGESNPLDILKKTSETLTEDYCQFEIFTERQEPQTVVQSFWDKIECKLRTTPPPTQPMTTPPMTPAPTMVPNPGPEGPTDGTIGTGTGEWSRASRYSKV